jgi:asparaginyl-tRNA synthetase
MNDDGRTVAAMDVLAPGIGEIIGGSQREERLDVLDRNMTERGIDQEHYAWDRDLRRYGTVPHVGLGFERTLAYVTGLANVRDAIPSRAPRERAVLTRNTDLRKFLDTSEPSIFGRGLVAVSVSV